MVKTYTFDVETDEYYLTAVVEVTFDKVDESFDHDFGTKRQYTYSPASCLILSVTHLNGPGEVDRSDRQLTQLIIEKAFARARGDKDVG